MSGAWLGQEAPLQLALVYLLIAYSVYVGSKVGMLSLAGVACYGVGAYATGYQTVNGTSAPVAIALATLGSAVLGLVLALLLARLQGLYLAMATFALVLLVGILALEWESVTGGAIGLLGLPLGVTTGQVLACVAVVVLGVALLERGRPGRALEAVRLDPPLAESIGIPVVTVRRAAFTLSAALGGFAGGLSAMLFGIFTPEDVSFVLIVNALTMIVIGGTGAWYGPVIGAAFVAWLPELLSFTGTDRPVIQAALVVLVVVLFPRGGVGLVQSVLALGRGRRAAPELDADEPVPVGERVP